MKSIPLTQGKFALVDDEDYDWLSVWKWTYSHGYAWRNRRVNEINKYPASKIYMYREIAGTPVGLDCDHVDHNGLNDQKANLRNCTHADNLRSGKARKGSSGYKGVWRNEKLQMWAANICVVGKTIHLGSHKDEVQAAKAYDEAAKKYFGEFALLNFK